MNPFPKVIEENGNSEEEQLMKLIQSNPQLLQKYQQEIAKFQSKNKSSQAPMTAKQYGQKLDTIEKYFDQQGGLTIQPTPVFVLKFLDKRTDQKIFVNIVTHDVIDHPEQKLLVDFQNQPGLRIPMSMGRVKEDHDKNGNICKVVDVVLNPTIVTTAEANSEIMIFTAQIIGNYLLEKYKIAVKDQMLKKVKGVKYKGNKVEIQRVKGRKAPKIQQISQEQKEIDKQRLQKEEQLFNELNNQEQKKVIEPEFQVVSYDKFGNSQPFSLLELQEKPIYFQITFELPHLVHSRGIHLEGSTKLLYLLVRGIYQIYLKMPFEVEKWESKFARKQRKLLVKAYPLQSKPEEKDQSKVNDRQSQNNNQVNSIEIQTDMLYDLV